MVGIMKEWSTSASEKAFLLVFPESVGVYNLIKLLDLHHEIFTNTKLQYSDLFFHSSLFFLS